MNRTKADQQRRRDLADAATGTPLRVPVVLYTCVNDLQDPHAVLAVLRRHAEARDWRVVGTAHDLCHWDIPLDDRPAWPLVEQQLATGQAHGLVVPALTELAVTPNGLSEFTAWVRDLHAFVFHLPEPSLPGVGAAR